MTGESSIDLMQLASETVPIWSPYDSFEGAATLLRMLNEADIEC